MSCVTITTNVPSSNYSAELEQYRQSGDICAYLLITIQINCSDKLGPDGGLAKKFDAFDAAGFHLSSSNSSSFLEWLLPSILRQFTVARCSYEQQLSIVNSEMFRNALVSMGSMVVLPQLVVPSSVAILAVLFNISLLIVTARKISMSTGCNWLLAFDSFCQIPALLPFLVNLFAVCARLDSIDFSVCMAMLMVSTGSSYAAFLAVYFMSLERFLIVLMPMRMNQLSEKTVKWLSLLAFLACTCLGLAMVYSIFSLIQPTLHSNINGIFDSYVYCNTGFYGYALSLYGVSHPILGLALLNYLLMAGLICWRRIFMPSTRTDSNNNTANSRATYRMLRSLFIISFVLIIGWLTGSVLFNQNEGGITMLTDKIAHALYTDSEEQAERFSYNLYSWIMGLTACLFPVAAGINAPVLIINNSDYRKAYTKTLAPLLACCRKRNASAIVPVFNNQDHQR